jgi:hypothetical protein
VPAVHVSLVFRELCYPWITFFFLDDVSLEISLARWQPFTVPRRSGTPIRRRMRCLTASRDRAERPNLETFTNASIHDRIVMRRIQLSFCILSRAKWLRMHLFALQPGPCAADEVLSPCCPERAQAIGVNAIPGTEQLHIVLTTMIAPRFETPMGKWGKPKQVRGRAGLARGRTGAPASLFPGICFALTARQSLQNF